MPTRNVNLTDHYDDLVGKLVEAGRFKNVSEAVRAALHLLEREEQTFKAKLEALRRDADKGQQAHDNGEFTVVEGDAGLDDFFAQIRAEARKR